MNYRETMKKVCCLGGTMVFLLLGYVSTSLAERMVSVTPEQGIEAGMQQAEKIKTAYPSEQLVIEFQDGTYFLNETWQLKPSLNGTESMPTIIRAAKNARPVISGGRVISGWKVGDDGRWRVTLEDVKAGNWYFAQLFVNDQRRFRPRLPKNGTYYITERIPEGENLPDKKFRFTGDEFNSNWKNLHDVEVMVCHNWTMSRNRIESVDDTDKIVQVMGTSSSNSSWGWFNTGNRFFIENVAEALSEPGEWYLDRGTGELTYIPFEGETPENTTVIAPDVEYLVNFTGEKNNRVQYIDVEGLIFAHSNWTTPPQGNTSRQAEVSTDGAIRLIGTDHCNFIHCGFQNIGHYGMGIGTACHQINVERCEFKDIGAGGIRIGGALDDTTDWPLETLAHGNLNELSEEERVTSDVHVQNCYFTYLGRLHPAGIGTWIGYAHDCSVQNCEFYDLYYSATSIGWIWGYARSVSHHNNVSYNRMHKIGQKFLSDMGGVYTLGISPGTQVSHNIIYDVDSFSYGGWGLYTDEGSSEIEMSYNIVYNTKTGSYHHHYGKDNHIVNNILVGSREHQLQRSRKEEHNSFFFERNIVYWENDSPLFGSLWDDDQYTMDNNLYFNPNHEVQFLGQSLQQWQENKKKDLHSIVADPMFVDSENHDYRLKPESPAFKLGFEQIDTKNVGPRYEADLLNNIPEPPAAFPLP